MIIKDITREVFKHHGIKFNSPQAAAFLELGHSIVKVADEHTTEADIFGQMFDPKVNHDISAEQLKKEKRAYKKRISLEGVWGVGLSVEGISEFDTFLWGIVGDEILDHEHVAELMKQMHKAALDNLMGPKS